MSKQSINMAIRRLNEYKKDVEQKTIKLATQLATNGAEIARIKLAEYGAIESGDLLSQIGGYFSPTYNTGVIKVSSKYAAFIEFGTGPQGASSPHPSGNGTYKSEGWLTAADGKPMDVMYGWQPIVLSNGDVIYYTEGQAAKPFMYDTARQLERDFIGIAREVFGS
jgi:hypothetical protein